MAPSSHSNPPARVSPGLRFGRRRFLQGSLAAPLLATAAAADSPRMAEIDLSLHDGALLPPAGPGWGVVPDPEFVRRFTRR